MAKRLPLPQRGRPRGGSDGVVRAVLQATLQQLGDRGFSALSVDEVARAAGVNKTSVYRRWPTKERLVVAAIHTLREQARPPAETGDLRQDLVSALRAKIALVGTRRGRKIARALSAFDDADVAKLLRALHVHRYGVPGCILENAIERGELSPASDPVFLSELLLAPLYHRILFLNQPVSDRYLRRVVDQVLAGAAPGGGKKKRN